MKILFAIWGFEQGGVATSFNTLANELELAGHEIKVILPYYRKDLDKQMAIPRRYVLGYTPEMKCTVPHVGMFWIVMNFLLRWKPYFALFKCDFPYDRFVFFHGQEMIWRWFRNVPSVMWFHEMASDKTCLPRTSRRNIVGQMIRWSKRNAVLGYTKYVAVTEASAISLQKYYGLKECPLVINNLIDFDGIVNKAKCEQHDIGKFDHARIGYIGRLAREKGVDRLLKAAIELKNHGYDFELFIIGAGPLSEELKQFAVRNKLENVHFLGAKSNPFPYLRSWDLTVLPSREEGMGLVLWESIIVGTPVMATRTGGATCALKDGRWGRLVENSREGILQGLKAYFQDASCALPPIGLANARAEIKEEDSLNRAKIRALFDNP